MMRHRPRGPVQQLAAAIGTTLVQLVGASGAKGAFEAADKCTGGFGRQISAAAFAIGAHFKHRRLL